MGFNPIDQLNSGAFVAPGPSFIWGAFAFIIQQHPWVSEPAWNCNSKFLKVMTNSGNIFPQLLITEARAWQLLDFIPKKFIIHCTVWDRADIKTELWHPELTLNQETPRVIKWSIQICMMKVAQILRRFFWFHWKLWHQRREKTTVEVGSMRRRKEQRQISHLVDCNLSR